jgi:hypothetical protein
MKSSNHTLSLHRPTSNSSSTTNFHLRRLNSHSVDCLSIPILLTLFNSQFQFSFSTYSSQLSWYSRCTDHIENTGHLLLLGADYTENTASSIVAWRRSHRKHSSYCRVLLFCLEKGRYVTILWANNSANKFLILGQIIFRRDWNIISMNSVE